MLGWVSPINRTLLSQSLLQEVHINHNYTESLNKTRSASPHDFSPRASWSKDVCGSQFMLLIVCGWIVMEKKLGPIHRTRLGTLLSTSREDNIPSRNLN